MIQNPGRFLAIDRTTGWGTGIEEGYIGVHAPTKPVFAVKERAAEASRSSLLILAFASVIPAQ